MQKAGENVRAALAIAARTGIVAIYMPKLFKRPFVLDGIVL
jgi:hypothetical protein